MAFEHPFPYCDDLPMMLPPDLSKDRPPVPAALPLPPDAANALRNLEQAIFNAYANTDDRADAFDLLTQLQAKLHKAPTRASLAAPPPRIVPTAEPEGRC
jgi:hypothetical protein